MNMRIIGMWVRMYGEYVIRNTDFGVGMPTRAIISVKVETQLLMRRERVVGTRVCRGVRRPKKITASTVRCTLSSVRLRTYIHNDR